MNQIAKLETIPSGRRIHEIMPDGQEDMDWRLGGDATKLLVSKLNQIIEEVTKLQHIAMATSSMLAGATPAAEDGGDGKADRPQSPRHAHRLGRRPQLVHGRRPGSYADVAKQFGVAKRSVEFQAKQATDADGNPTTWAILRRDVGDQALEQHEEKLAAEQSKRNDQHTYMYRRMQELTLKKIDSMYHGKPVMLKDSSPLLGPDGKPVMLFPDGVEL
jgi:hypothetical protein